MGKAVIHMDAPRKSIASASEVVLGNSAVWSYRIRADRRPIRKVSAFRPPTRRSSLSICGARCRYGIPSRPQTCKALDLVGTLEINSSGYRAFSERGPMGKANAALPARANRKAMVRAARRLHFRYDLRLAEAQSNRAYHPAEQENNGELNKKTEQQDARCSWTDLRSVDFSGMRRNRTR